MISFAGLASRVGTIAQNVKSFVGGSTTLEKNPPKGFRKVHHPGAIKRIMEAGWQLDALNNFVSSYLPSVAVVVEVDVLGSPLSTKQELYYLALSMAFGVIDYQMVSTSDNTIEVMIDHTGKHVRVKMSQSYSGLFDNVRSNFNINSGNRVIRNPPKENINGNNWPPFLQTTNPILVSQENLVLPQGTLISEQPAPTYQPQLNNGSTENDLVNLISASILGSGCSNPTKNSLAELIKDNKKVSPVTS